MPITYKNRKNVTYTLYQCPTKTGKLRYYFAKESEKGTPCQKIPQGYEVSETPNGVVSLVKSRPKLIHDSELEAVKKALDDHPSGHRYRIFIRNNRIDIYEAIGPDADEFIDRFQDHGLGSRLSREELNEWLAARSKFEAVLRFILLDEETRLYQVERMCYLGSIEDWIPVGKMDKIERLAESTVAQLGTESFFELF